MANRKHNEYEMCDKETVIGKLSNGDVFYFDLEDFDLVKKYYWNTNYKGYISSTDRDTKKQVFIHRLVLGFSPSNEKTQIDHIDRNKRNNKKINLRAVSGSENCFNKDPQSNNTSGIIGVYWNKKGKVWEVAFGGKYIGRSRDKEEAIIKRLKIENKVLGEMSPQKHLFQKYGIIIDAN